MAILAHLTDFTAAPATQATRPGLLRRVYDAIVDAQQRRAQRDIERLVAGRAGIFNDALEMEIGQRLLPRGWDN
ncbi:MAG TPA: hypothetical protein VFB45_00255 [Pseudolabrys sp.]|nr:hypothetical protein [Pseudolabrys sp.]